MSNASLAERLSLIKKDQRETLLKEFSTDELAALYYNWQFWARPNQRPPAGDWFCWMVLAGRGFGKTRMGAEWIKQKIQACRSEGGAQGSQPIRIALIGQTANDAREIMVEGESGILSVCPPDNFPRFEISRRRLVWPNGCMAYLYSAEEPDQLRGPQHHFAWCDELAKWRAPEKCWSNLLFGLRLGQRPQVIITTTPRPMALLQSLIADETTVVTRGSTFENRAHLSQQFVEQMHRLYMGTRLGRQELLGEIIEEVEGALWSYPMIERARQKLNVELARIVVAIDPPVSQGDTADACGIIVVGRGCDQRFYVLADRSIKGASPLKWAKTAIAAYEEFKADRLVAEVNNGGDLVETIVRQLAPNVSYRAVRASRGKIARAEPIAALYEQGLVHHTDYFKRLEEEMLNYTAEKGQSSPDRMDALVWGLTEVAFGTQRTPKIRSI